MVQREIDVGNITTVITVMIFNFLFQQLCDKKCGGGGAKVIDGVNMLAFAVAVLYSSRLKKIFFIGAVLFY